MRAVVADLSHHNWDGGMWPEFALARSAGLVGVIYKASEGSTYQDPTYQQIRRLAVDAGLLWGAYHFGTAADVASQVANFLATADPDNQTLLVIDFEANDRSPRNTMSHTQMLEFADRCENRLARSVTIYTGPYMYWLFGQQPVPEIGARRVWWARYADAVDLHPTWQRYWLWQYTDGHNGPKPHGVPGLGFCDCNHFDGGDAALQASWLA